MMGEMGIKFPDNIVFSNEKNYILKNDFSFHIYKRSSGKSESVNKTSKRRDLAKVYIKGLERLFDDDSSSGSMMDIFAKSFHTNGNDEWSVSYGHFGQSDEKCLEIVCNASELEENFSVDFLLSREFEFNAKFKDEESIVLTVIFENFDIFFPDIENSVTANYFVIAKEMPYIEEFIALDPDGNKVYEVYKGKTVEITWSVGNIEKVSTSLCDENGEVLSNVAPYKVTIDRDRRFTLKAEKNGQVITKTLNIGLKLFNFPSDVEFFAVDKKGRRTNAVFKNDYVKIKWSSIRDPEKKSYLCDEEGEVLKEASGAKEYEVLEKVMISRNRVFTLKIEYEGQVAYKTLNINATWWERQREDSDFSFIMNPSVKSFESNAEIQFKSDGKTCNKIWKVFDHYFIYIYPAWYVSKNLEKWVKIDTGDNSPKNFEFYMGDVAYEGLDENYYRKFIMHVYFILHDKYVETRYSIKISCNGIKEGYKFNVSEKNEKPLYFPPNEKQSKINYFMQMLNYNKTDIFVVYNKCFGLYEGIKDKVIFEYLQNMDNFISTDLIYISKTNEIYIALLFKNYVVLHKWYYEKGQYLYSKDNYELVNYFEFDRKDQKNVFLSYNKKNKKLYIILDNYVFESNGKEIYNEIYFSPKDTIKNINDSDVFYIHDIDQGATEIIVRDGNKASLWGYDASIR